MVLATFGTNLGIRVRGVFTAWIALRKFPDIFAEEMRGLRSIEKPLWVVLATFGTNLGIRVRRVSTVWIALRKICAKA